MQQAASGVTATVEVLDTSTATTTARGSLVLAGVAGDALVLATPVFSASSAAIGLVFSVTNPVTTRAATKPDPRTGGTLTFRATEWASHHELAYFDVGTQTFTGPFDLADGPSLAHVSALATDRDLFVWTVAEAARPLPKGFGTATAQPSTRPVAQLAAYPLGEGQARFAVPTADPWPVSGEPVTIVSTGNLARLAYGHTVQEYSPDTGRVTQHAITELRIPSAKPGAPQMQPQPDGSVLLANPVIGRALIADPANSFAIRSIVRFAPPAASAGGPPSKAALSPDGKTLYVLGAAATGGIADGQGIP